MRHSLIVCLAAVAALAISATPGSSQTAGASGKSRSPQAGGNAMPSCTQPLAGIDAPDAPHGLFVPLFPNAPMNAEANKYLLHNPVVCGANFYVVWSQSDKGPGATPRYDFGYVDDQMAPWIAAGKQ